MITNEVIKMFEQVVRLMVAIKSSGLSYVELEKRTGIAKSSIQRYASGRTKKIPVDAVKLIADATGSSAAWIMGWEEDGSTTKEEPRNLLKIAGRDGSMIERQLTDSQLAALMAILDPMPDAEDDRL